MINRDCDTVILADGAFPENGSVLDILKQAKVIICCDGAADSLLAHGMIPDFVVGDLDSVSNDVLVRFPEKLIKVSEQETNDLAICFRFAREKGFAVTHLLGASGKREDHLLGNLAQFAEFSKDFPEMLLVTDYGYFAAVTEHAEFTGLNINVYDEGKFLLPIFTMGKYFERDGKRMLPLAIQVHHAVCDGYHVGVFVEKLQEYIDCFAN
jgi:thiamine pyrophosphokinase